MRTRRVLMMCYYFPPINASGCNRSLAFSRNLPASNWEPVVLSVTDTKDPWVKTGAPIPEGIRIERAPEWNLAGFLDFFHAVSSRLCGLMGIDLKTNYFREILAVPDTQIAWRSVSPGVKLAKECDVIYASCSPFSSALSAVRVKQRTGKPLVLDFRDAWSLNPHIQHLAFHTKRIARLERYVLKFADHLIVNTEGAARLYRQAYPEFAGHISAIPNGYDKLTPVTRQARPGDPFRIVHVGTFYGARQPDILLEALAELPEINAEFVQIGGSFPSYDTWKNKVKITVYPLMPQAEALELMQTASLLYLKQGYEAHIKYDIAVAAKTYEYIATGLPILAKVPLGDNADIIERYAADAKVISDPNSHDLKQIIRGFWERRDAFHSEIRAEFIREFDRVYLTQRLAAIFDQVVGGATQESARELN